MDLRVEGQAFLIVGGTAGMGFEAARVLAADGARVAVAGRDHDRAHAAAAAVAAEHGTRVVAVAGDVSTHQDEADRIVATAIDAIGPLAGVAVTTGTNTSAHSTLEDATDATWAESFEETLMGTVRAVKAALPGLVERGGGTVVTTAAYSIHSPHANRMPYVALEERGRDVHQERRQVVRTAGCARQLHLPGRDRDRQPRRAARAQLAESRGLPPEGLLEGLMRDEWHMDVALGRPGRPEELGDLFAFLLSGRAGYLTGALVNIDGGTDF